MRWLIALISLLTILFVAPQVAYADIVFVNMNGSSSEIPAAQSVANQFGEKLFVLPEQKTSAYTTEQLTQDLVRLAKLGIRPRAMIISGHHVKNQSYFGTNGEVSLHGVLYQMPKDDAQLQSFFASIQSLYLWGCYTGTLTNADRLLRGYGTPFVNSKYVVGFADKAPLATVAASGQVLKDMLLREAQFRASAPAQTLALVQQVSAAYRDRYDFILHKDTSFFNKDAYSEVEHFVSECKVESNRKDILDTVRTVWKYYWNEAGPLPAETGKGPLREAYRDLQKSNFCVQMGAMQLAQGQEFPPLNLVIRLIYYKNVVQNFARIYATQLEFAKNEMQSIGLEDVEFITQLPQTDRGVAMKKLEGLHATIKKIFPAYKTELEDKAKYFYFNSMINDIESVIYPSEEYVPQSWIETESQEKSWFPVLNDFEKAKAKTRKKAQRKLGETESAN